MSNTYRHKKIAKWKRIHKVEGRWATRKEVQEAFPELFKKTNGKGSPIAKCNCNGCKSGLRTHSGDVVLRRAIRSNRQKTRLHVWIEDGEGVESKIPIGYTD